MNILVIEKTSMELQYKTFMNCLSALNVCPHTQVHLNTLVGDVHACNINNDDASGSCLSMAALQLDKTKVIASTTIAILSFKTCTSQNPETSGVRLRPSCFKQKYFAKLFGSRRALTILLLNPTKTFSASQMMKFFL